MASSPKPVKAAARKRSLTGLRRAEIIAAALKVFAQKGFHHARTEDVAAEAKIAKGTLYLYFPSKDAIYDAALKHSMAELHELVQEQVAAATDTKERIQAWVYARLEFWDRHGDLYHMILTVGRERAFRKQTAQLLRTAMEDLAAILEAAVSAGELPPRDVRAIAWLVMDSIRGSNERRILHLCQNDIRKDTALIVETVLRYFLP